MIILISLKIIDSVLLIKTWTVKEMIMNIIIGATKTQEWNSESEKQK